MEETVRVDEVASAGRGVPPTDWWDLGAGLGAGLGLDVSTD